MNKFDNKYLLIVLVAIVYFFAARLGLMLAYPGTNATPLWLPTGIALSVMLLWGNRMWPGIALGAFAANFQQLGGLGLSMPAAFAAALSTSAGNTLEALMGAYLIHRFTGTRNPFERSAHVFAFILFGALISTIVSSTMGTVTLCLSLSDWSNFPSIWLTWWLGDAAGAIILVPLVMTFKRFDSGGWKIRPMAGDLLLWMSIFAVCYAIFSRTVPLNFLLFPMLIIAAFRLGQFGSALAVGVISIASTYATVNGTGPFSAMNLTGALLLQQGFVGSIATATMVLSSIVTEQKTSELKVAESEKRSRMLIEQAPIGIILSRDGIILDANRVSGEMFGFTDIQELRGTTLKNRFAQQDKSDILDRRGEHAQEPMIGTAYETTGLRKDGSPFPFYVSINRIVLADGPLTIRFFIDISERKRAEVQLRRTNRTLSAISRCNELVAHAVEEKVLLEDICRSIVEVEGYRFAWIGFAEHTESKTVQPVAQAGFEEGYLATMKITWADTERGRGPTGTAIRTSKPYVCQHILTDPQFAPWRDDAEKRGYESSIALPMLLNGQPLGALSIYADEPDAFDEESVALFLNTTETLAFGISSLRTKAERNKAVLELEKHQEHLEAQVLKRTADLQRNQRALTNLVEDLNFSKTELTAANQKLKEIDHLKSLFIASMSHELRTPLNSIIGFTGILLQGLAGDLNAEQKKQLGMVKGSSEHLLSLITDIIDLSKVEAGKIDLSMEQFDLSAIVREVLGSFQVMADRKSLVLSSELQPGIMVMSDKRRIRQVLVNLVGNAIKFTERGGVNVLMTREDGYLKVFVQDTGMGIKQGDLDKLFKSFSQVTTPEEPKHEGTGLGLYLSRKLINLLGGEIRVESEFGRGSVFSFTLPMKK